MSYFYFGQLSFIKYQESPAANTKGKTVLHYIFRDSYNSSVCKFKTDFLFFQKYKFCIQLYLTTTNIISFYLQNISYFFPSSKKNTSPISFNPYSPRNTEIIIHIFLRNLPVSYVFQQHNKL